MTITREHLFRQTTTTTKSFVDPAALRERCIIIIEIMGNQVKGAASTSDFVVLLLAKIGCSRVMA